MGKRGPKPMPTPILRLRGSWRAETRENEPQVPAGAVAPPPWVREADRKHWTEICAVLESMGVMSPVHSVSLSLFVQAVADWIDASAKADKAPMTSVTAAGGETIHPLQRLKATTFARVLQLCREFGLTPSAITGVKSMKPEEKKGLSAFRLGGTG
jgi:P27 family predicted phage terminase small subunit